MLRSIKNRVHRVVNTMGFELIKIRKYEYAHQVDENYIIDVSNYNKIQYGSGIKLLNGWANVDSLPIDLIITWRNDQLPDAAQNPVNNFFYRPLDLTSRQPFADDSFEFGFCEDFIEHLTQAESITFLSECYRVLKPGGVLRMSFPGLEGILKTHYFSPTGYKSAIAAKEDCYDQWEHYHFYSREELRLVATHLGYSRIDFPCFGESMHPELKGLETRENQKQVNTYVELTK